MPQEFFLIVSPPAAIRQHVAFLKRRVQQAFHHPLKDTFSKAHISLLKYRDAHTESFLYDAHEVVAAFSPFDASIKELRIFHHGVKRTIYLAIEPQCFLAALAKALTGKNITPHITIARDLAPADFEKAWKALRNTSYHASFTCDQVTVLKRANSRWQPHVSLPLVGCHSTFIGVCTDQNMTGVLTDQKN